MLQRSFSAVIILWALSSAACTMDDADRCPDGYFYMEDLYACCNSETHMPSEDGQSCIPIPVDSGVTDSGAADGGGLSGFEEPCTTHADCADFDATYCLMGEICTIESCDTVGCPTDYTCCGPCPTSENKQVCVPDDSVGLAETFGCPCASE